MLKRKNPASWLLSALQPPSGGCVLKPFSLNANRGTRRPAAFRRLCVETFSFLHCFVLSRPAAFRRLCVETCYIEQFCAAAVPAAFRRLCVETTRLYPFPNWKRQPPSGGCVLKQLGIWVQYWNPCQPPSGGCVLKPSRQKCSHPYTPSRLQAAVC